MVTETEVHLGLMAASTPPGLSDRACLKGGRVTPQDSEALHCSLWQAGLQACTGSALLWARIP